VCRDTDEALASAKARDVCAWARAAQRGTEREANNNPTSQEEGFRSRNEPDPRERANREPRRDERSGSVRSGVDKKAETNWAQVPSTR
jgi:hypothetical protein